MGERDRESENIPLAHAARLEREGERHTDRDRARLHRHSRTLRKEQGWTEQE